MGVHIVCVDEELQQIIPEQEDQDGPASLPWESDYLGLL